MADIQDAHDLVDRTAGEIGMTEEDRHKSNDLLMAYGEGRQGIMDAMLNLLNETDTSDLRSNWIDYCEKRKDLLEQNRSGGPSNR